MKLAHLAVALFIAGLLTAPFLAFGAEPGTTEPGVATGKPIQLVQKTNDRGTADKAPGKTAGRSDMGGVHADQAQAKTAEKK